MTALPVFNHADVILDPDTARFRCLVAWVVYGEDETLSVHYDPHEPSLRLRIEQPEGRTSFWENADGTEHTIYPGVHVDLHMANPSLVAFSLTGATFRGTISGTHIPSGTREPVAVTGRYADIRLSHDANGFPVGTAHRRLGSMRETAKQYGGQSGAGHMKGLAEASTLLHDLTGTTASGWRV